MPDRPLVSIVTPTLNQGRFIEATIRSIRSQTYENIEHIVVDGGSTDGTVEILRALDGAYRMRWTSGPDSGMYEALNKGLAMARGEILAYLNSDDLYLPWTVETVVEHFRRAPSADFLFGDALSVQDETAVVRPYWTPPFDLGYLRAVGFLAQPTVFWRRAAWEALGAFDESLRYVADCAYWMRAGEHYRFDKVNEFLAVERDHASAQRLSTGGAVWTELDRVRSRYRTPCRVRRLVYRLRRAFWTRVYPLALLVNAYRPGGPRGPWSRMLATRSLGISPWRLVMRTVPRAGERFADHVFRPSRRWLEPVGPE